MNERTSTSRFRIEDSLGKGGMGEVVRAWDTVLARYVALKWVRHDQRDDASVSGRFQREARAVASLRHPNIVTVYDLGEENGSSYLVMELLEGRPMNTLIGESSIEPLRRLRWLRDIASALAAAHQAGLIHRDIKPSNVMVCHDGTVKVLDFGIAKWNVLRPVHETSSGPVPSFRTARGVVLGTPAYMAPEQARGEHIDDRVDQFSWGVIAYELMSGLRRHATSGRAVELPGVSPQMAAVFQRAMEPNPSARFQSMATLLVEFDRAMGVAMSTPSLPPAYDALKATDATRDVSGERTFGSVAIVPSPTTNSSTAGRSPTLLLAISVLAVFVALTLAFSAGIFFNRANQGASVSRDRDDARRVRRVVLRADAPEAASQEKLAELTVAAPVTSESSAKSSTGRPAPAESADAEPPQAISRTLVLRDGKWVSESEAESAPPERPPSVPGRRVRYGGSLRSQFSGEASTGGCPTCDGEAFYQAVQAHHARFRPCFAQTIFEPPFHSSPRFDIQVSANGEYGAARQIYPSPGHPRLTACVAQVMKDLPSVNRGGKAGKVSIQLDDDCIQPFVNGSPVYDECRDP